MRDIQLRFKDGLVTGGEQKGERVGLLTAGRYSLQRGSSIANVKITNVGTGIYSPSEADGQEACSFSVTYDSLTIENFSYRGIDFFRPGTHGQCLPQSLSVFRRLRGGCRLLFQRGGERDVSPVPNGGEYRAKQPVHLGMPGRWRRM